MRFVLGGCKTSDSPHLLAGIIKVFGKFMVSKGDMLGCGGMLGVWDGNVTKLGCDDHCTTINIISSLSNIKKKFM